MTYFASGERTVSKDHGAGPFISITNNVNSNWDCVRGPSLNRIVLKVLHLESAHEMLQFETLRNPGSKFDSDTYFAYGSPHQTELDKT